jgi:hypothetical protein
MISQIYSVQKLFEFQVLHSDVILSLFSLFFKGANFNYKTYLDQRRDALISASSKQN